MKSLILLAALFVQDTDGVQQSVDKIVEGIVDRMRESIAERKKATDDLLDLAKNDRRVPPAIWKVLEREEDPRIKTRLKFVARPFLLMAEWEQNYPRTVTKVIGFKDTCFLQMSDQRMAALEAKTGKEKWSSGRRTAWTGSPVAAGDFLYIVAGSKENPVAQRVKIESGGLSGGLYLGSTKLYADGDRILYYRRSMSRVCCEDAVTKRRLWEVPVPRRGPFSMAGGKAVVWDGDKTLLCLDANEGEKIWKGASDPGLTAMGIHGNRLITRSKKGMLRGYDMKDGKELWKIDIPPSELTGDIVFHRNTALFLGEQLVCRDVETGKALWASKPPGYKKDKPAIRAGAYLIFQHANELVAIDPDTGTEAGRINTGLASITSIAATGRMIFVGSTTGTLLGFKVVPGGR